VPFEDLLNEGNLGLIQAVQRFDASRGTKFITFAVWWIRKEILAALARGMDPVRIPDYQRRKWRDIRRDEESLGRMLRRSPGREELARSLSFRPAKFYQAALLCNPRTRSLDEPASPESPSSLGDQLPDVTAISGEEDLLRREAIELVTRTLARLRPQERRVLEYRYGLRAGNGLVLSEVGRRMSVSRERVRQIEVQAIRRLRQLLANRLV
jgi:RNA polymerase sigma factor (sigma-70 family)